MLINLLYFHNIVFSVIYTTVPSADMPFHSTTISSLAHLDPFLSLALSKLRLGSANHRPGYWSNLPCDWPSTASAYSKQETENGPCFFCNLPIFHNNNNNNKHHLNLLFSTTKTLLTHIVTSFWRKQFCLCSALVTAQYCVHDRVLQDCVITPLHCTSFEPTKCLKWSWDDNVNPCK